MAEIDTSSYPKPGAYPAQKSALEIASQLGGLKQQQQQIQANAIGIDQAKLDLTNQRYKIVSQKFLSLRNKPYLSAQDIVNESQDAVKQGLSTPEQHAQFVTEIPSKAALQRKYPQATPEQINQAYTQTLRDHIDKKVLQAEDTMAAINHVYGVPGASDNGQSITPTRQGLIGGPVPVGAPIQKQLPIETPVATPGGTQQLGPQTPQLPANALPVQGGLPGQYQPPRALPVGPLTSPAIPGPSSNLGGTVLGATVEPNRIVPRGPMVSQPPMFEEGRKQLAADQDLATQKLTAIKPILQALPYLKDLRTGPGTESFNKAVAFLKANNIISTNTKNDATAIYQEVNKKLHQYVSQSPLAGRSDAAQTLSEASSPSLNAQINPALVKLTKDAIALDRVQAARGNGFIDENGNARSDLQNYPTHRSTFPARMDERAFGLDTMEPSERKSFIKDMASKLKSKNSDERFEANRFFKSLDIVDKQGLINTHSE